MLSFNHTAIGLLPLKDFLYKIPQMSHLIETHLAFSEDKCSKCQRTEGSPFSFKPHSLNVSQNMDSGTVWKYSVG